MRLVVHGQQAFGKAVLERLLERNENVVGVFCAPDREGRPTDPLKEFALERGLAGPPADVLEDRRGAGADALVRARPVRDGLRHAVGAAARARRPEARHDPVPSLAAAPASRAELDQLADHPGRDPDRDHDLLAGRGLDEGPILLQKEVAIGPDDTLGSLYFNHLFPMGVDAMIEAIDLVREGKAPRIAQDESQATYESWCRKADAEIDWSRPAAEVYNLIRGTDPQPGAWTVIGGNEVQIYESAIGATSGAPGTRARGRGRRASRSPPPDGSIVVKRVRPKGGKKMDAGEFAKETGLRQGARLGA